MQVIEANWVAFAVALLAILVIGWLIFRKSTRPKARSHRPDVLDEGVAPAQRNQALIDSPAAVANAAASVAATGPDVMAGMGEVAAAAVVEEVQARPQTPAERLAPVFSAAAGADDLSRIKGVGPKLVTLLHSLGITRYSQIADWTAADIARIDLQLGTFAGRIRRDNWIEQARFLAAGDTAGFESKYGKL